MLHNAIEYALFKRTGVLHVLKRCNLGLVSFLLLEVLRTRRDYNSSFLPLSATIQANVQNDTDSLDWKCVLWTADVKRQLMKQLFYDQLLCVWHFQWLSSASGITKLVTKTLFWERLEMLVFKVWVLQEHWGIQIIKECTEDSFKSVKDRDELDLLRWKIYNCDSRMMTLFRNRWEMLRGTGDEDCQYQHQVYFSKVKGRKENTKWLRKELTARAEHARS